MTTPRQQQWRNARSDAEQRGDDGAAALYAVMALPATEVPGKWARCNFDGRPLSPGDQAGMDTFRLWLQMDAGERRDAVRLDPEWRKFALGDEGPA